MSQELRCILTYLIHSISMRCCSARLFSLFTFLCNAVNINLRSAKAFPQLALSARSSSFPWPVLISVLASPPGWVILKYSSSSLSTMIACFDRRGLEDWSVVGSPGVDGMDCWAWNRSGVVGEP